MANTDLNILTLPDVRPDRAPVIDVRQIADAAGWADARALLFEYLAWAHEVSGIDPLTVQPWIRDDLSHLEKWYAPPRSALLLATANGNASGVVGLSTHDGSWAELKRLYVSPAARGHQLGERLVRAALAAARSLGCQTVRLETLPDLMGHAVALYQRLGFRPTEPFDSMRLKGVLYLECPATPLAASAEPHTRI